jgi:hypothetical protein
MKTNLRYKLLGCFLLLTSFAFAQANNLVVFSNDGYRFTLIVNGLRQNEKPETNVKVTGLTAPNYKVKVIFEDANYAPIDQQLYMQWGGEDLHGKELNCAIVNGKKGLKLRPESASDITTTAAANQVVMVFNPNASTTQTYSQTTTTTTEPVTTGTVVTTSTGDQTGGTATSGVAVTDGTGTTSTSTTTSTTTTGNGASVGMNVDGVSVNINISDNTGGTATSTSTTTTTTTTSSSSTSTTGGTTTTTAPAPVTEPGCVYAMSSSDFANAKASITKQSFEDGKLKVAKQVLSTNCMSSAQVKEIMALFSFEETRLDWAKFAYGKTSDPQNYYQLNDGFTFSTSVDDLNAYIEAHKK